MNCRLLQHDTISGCNDDQQTYARRPRAGVNDLSLLHRTGAHFFPQQSSPCGQLFVVAAPTRAHLSIMCCSSLPLVGPSTTMSAM